jgi:E3 ubiquitin-protein ligase HERC1
MENGSEIPVTFENRLSFADLAVTFRLREFDRHLSAIYKGFAALFRPSARYFAPQELELLVAGQASCPIDQMKKHVIVPDNQLGKMLWRVLESFTAEERMMFIKFGCGRMSLPAPGLRWSSNLKVHFVPLPQTPKGVNTLPEARTCSWTMLIPAYPTDDIMAARLRMALKWGWEIDLDHAPDLGAIDRGA